MRFYMILFASFLVVVVIFIFVNNPEMFDYVMKRVMEVSESSGFEDRLEHTGGGNIDLFSLFGNGYGRYSMRARDYGAWAIIDSEYQKHLAELGVIGFLMLVFMLASGFLVSISKRSLLVNTLILGFYIVTFVGASALSASLEFPFVFWLVLGEISRNWNIKLKLVNNRSVLNGT